MVTAAPESHRMRRGLRNLRRPTSVLAVEETATAGTLKCRATQGVGQAARELCLVCGNHVPGSAGMGHRTDLALSFIWELEVEMVGWWDGKWLTGHPEVKSSQGLQNV
jgi:hypothetical protein